jgi:hypothetical protein
MKTTELPPHFVVVNLLVLDVLVEYNDCNLDIELGVFAKKHEQRGLGVIDSFISFLTKYNGKKTQNFRF